MQTKEYQKQWRLKNRDKINEYNRAYRLKNIDKFRAYAREYNKKYRLKNRDYLLEQERKNERLRDGTGTTEEGYLYNYKEPLAKFEEGFGYKGTISYNENGDKIQCHFCGLFFESLGYHINKIHSLRAFEYKNKVGLMSSTSLIGESLRKKFIERNIKYSDVINPAIKKGLKKALKARATQPHSKKSLEQRNLEGSCPDQLLDKILTLKEKLNRVPSWKDFYREYEGNYLGAIQLTFGSWAKALYKVGLISVGETNAIRTSESNLLEYLRDFYTFHQRTPRTSDFSRGLLPHQVTFTRKFGSLNEARFRAGIPVLVRMGLGSRGFTFKELPIKNVKRYQGGFIEKQD